MGFVAYHFKESNKAVFFWPLNLNFMGYTKPTYTYQFGHNCLTSLDCFYEFEFFYFFINIFFFYRGIF